MLSYGRKFGRLRKLEENKNHAQFTDELNEALRVDRLAPDHKRTEVQEFPGSPIVRTWSFHCPGPRFNPTSHTAQPGKREREKE